MNNKLAPLIVLPIMLFFAVWLMSQVATMHEFHQTFIVGFCVVMVMSLVIATKVTYDVKLMIFLLLGYSFGGKGFAYISPFEPFYISEVCLAICFVFALLRIRSFNYVTANDGRPIALLLMFMMAVSFYRLLLFDFPAYRMMAIRDSALAYYALFFVMSFLAMEIDSNFKAFKKILPICCGLGLIAATLVRFELHITIASAVPYLGRIFLPHDDIFKPLCAALAVTMSVLYIHKKKIWALPVAIFATLVLIFGQTSGVVALLFSFLFLLVTTRRREFIFLSILGVFALMIGIGALAMSASLGGEEYIGKEHVNTFKDILEFDTTVSNDNTTNWRLGWWTVIWEETMDYSPLFGLGFGADLSGEFQDITNVGSVARYPHNVAFTVLGRTGLLGVLIFMILLSMILLHLRKGAKMILKQREIDYHFLLAVSFVTAGIANGFLQMTYEGPYAAIPHWIVLGYVFAYMRRYKQGRLEV